MTLSPSNMYTSPDKSLKVDYQLLALKNNLDNSFLEVKAQEHGSSEIPKISTEYQPFPIVVDRILKNLDAVAMYGSFYLILIPLATFIVIFDEMMREKIDNLRRGMQLLGTLDSAYWASWIITSFVLNIFLAFSTIVCGNLA